MNSFLLKAVLFFVAGGVVALFAVAFFVPRAQNRSVLGDKTEITLDDQFHKVGRNGVNLFWEKIKETVFPYFSESPAFEPLMRTTQDLQRTTSEVKSLPQDQKSAICREICGE